MNKRFFGLFGLMLALVCVVIAAGPYQSTTWLREDYTNEEVEVGRPLLVDDWNSNGTVDNATTDGSLYVKNTLEVDGTSYLATLESTSSVTSSDLVLESENPMTIKLNNIDGLQIDNTTISGFAADTDTAGNNVYVRTETGGATPTAARNGGLFHLFVGDGSSSAAAVAAGAGGGLTLKSGLGGANTGGATGQVGGAGGAVGLQAGAGGATNSTGAHAGGAGGTVTITAGTGGNASAGTGDGGASGDIVLAVASGGTSSGGNAGAPGKVAVSGGMFHWNAAQVIDMADAEVNLTLVPGTPSGTLMTSNILRVDANSGATENLDLPPEADFIGMLVVVNTGGESIVVRNDAETTVDTVATAEFGIFFCDGTAWSGQNKS